MEELFVTQPYCTGNVAKSKTWPSRFKPLAPIDVVELEASNLARAQPVDNEQKQNGAVT